MSGQILQISISAGGVPKHPVLQGQVEPLGIAGDVQRNLKYHGGPRQALPLAELRFLHRLAHDGADEEEDLDVIGVAPLRHGMGTHVPKGYVYFAMAFSLGVEVLNIRMRKRAATPVKLHAPHIPGD